VDVSPAAALLAAALLAGALLVVAAVLFHATRALAHAMKQAAPLLLRPHLFQHEHTLTLAAPVAVHHTLSPDSVDLIGLHVRQWIRLSQLGVPEIPRAEPLAGTPDTEVEMQNALRQRAIDRGASELMARAQAIGAHLTPEQARTNAQEMLARLEAPA
jgi:hypothetical protein